jgi:hypothetical protein
MHISSHAEAGGGGGGPTSPGCQLRGAAATLRAGLCVRDAGGVLSPTAFEPPGLTGLVFATEEGAGALNLALGLPPKGFMLSVMAGPKTRLVPPTAAPAAEKPVKVPAVYKAVPPHAAAPMPQAMLPPVLPVSSQAKPLGSVRLMGSLKT